VENRPHNFPRLRALITTLVFLLITGVSAAETVRVATYNVSLGRKGPGLLLKDLMSGEDAQIASLVTIIQHIRPDILLLNEFDHDHQNLALTAFRDALAHGDNGIDYTYSFAPAGNEGRPSFLDLDGDGKAGEWADALGFGKFPGSEGMALLSRYPIDTENARSFTKLLWSEIPDAQFPKNTDGSDYLLPEISSVIPFSHKSHWDIPVDIDGTQLNILASHATPPVFDGAENINGLRNFAEVWFWVTYLNGTVYTDDAGKTAVGDTQNFVLLGDLNVDPKDGEGFREPIDALLNHPRINDPHQTSLGAAELDRYSGGANMTQLGQPIYDTVEWDDDIGNMRVDYALPSTGLRVIDSGVFWPVFDAPFTEILGEGREGASNHHMVWVDVLIE